MSTDEQERLGTLKIGKTRISLSQLTLPQITDTLVEDRSVPVGMDPERRPLGRYINRENLFTVLFSDLALAYIDAALFRDEALLNGGEDFLRHLRAEPRLINTTSEKGAFATGQRAFDQASVFQVLSDGIAHDCDVLICDDLGDEWADFIGLTTDGNPKMVSFYHAKHGTRSLGASPFHDAIAQAIKNLGRMTLPPEAMAAKYASWEEPYRNDRVQTGISRIMRGGARAEIERAVEATRGSPDLVKRVFVVTSSLSRAQVAQVFEGAEEGRAPSAHFVQLYWLLVSYFSACTEVGVTGYVICQP